MFRDPSIMKLMSVSVCFIRISQTREVVDYKKLYTCFETKVASVIIVLKPWNFTNAIFFLGILKVSQDTIPLLGT